MMLLRKFAHVIFLLAGSLYSSQAVSQADGVIKGKEQSPEEFRRKAMMEVRGFTDSAKHDLAKFTEEANREYADALKKAWAEIRPSQPVKSYKAPKPTLPPIAVNKKPVDDVPAPPPPKQTAPPSEPPHQPKNIQPEVPKVPQSTPEAIPQPVPTPQPKQVPQPKPQPVPSPKPDVGEVPVTALQQPINFFNMVIGAPAPNPQWPVMSREVSNAGISDYWQRASKCDMHQWLGYVATVKDSVGGGDYAVYQVVNKISANYFNDAATAQLFCWYSLMQNGFDIKTGYNNGKIYLLVYSRSEIFGHNYFVINEKKYYCMDADPGESSIHICPGNFKLTSHTLNPDINPSLALKTGLETRKLSFTFQDREYNISLRYCPQHIDYLFMYPQLTYSDYLASEAGDWFDRQLKQQFSPILAKLSERDGIQFLLSFVQHAFQYQDDQRQFGREKWNFPEETIRYPYSDCDDRAIFFGYLVKKLTGHNVLGLLYPNHVCTAVLFNQNIEGDKIIYKNNTFVVCDPTYVGASIGMSMPEFKNATPEVFE